MSQAKNSLLTTCPLTGASDPKTSHDNWVLAASQLCRQSVPLALDIWLSQRAPPWTVAPLLIGALQHVNEDGVPQPFLLPALTSSNTISEPRGEFELPMKRSEMQTRLSLSVRQYYLPLVATHCHLTPRYDSFVFGRGMSFYLISVSAEHY